MTKSMDFGMYTPLEAKIYEKDPQTLSEVIRLVLKLNEAEQQRATLTPSMVSMMSNVDRCFVCGWMGHFGHHWPCVQFYACNEFGHFALDCHNKIPPSGTPHTKTNLIQGIKYTHIWRDSSTPPIMVMGIGDISTDQNPTAVHTATGAAASEGTHHVPHPASIASCAALKPRDTPFAIHTMTHPTSIVTPHPTLATSPTNITYAIISQTGAGLAPTTPTALHRKQPRKAKPDPRPSTPIDATVLRLSSSGTPCQIVPQIHTVTLIL